MKNIKYTCLLFVALLVAACSGDPDIRFQQFNELDKGAFARNLALDGAFDLGNIAGSSLVGTVEFYDENQGKDVATFSFAVEFNSNGGNGGNDVASVDFLTIPSASFVVNADGLPGTTYTLGMQDAVDALGIDPLTLTAGDRFRFSTTITMTSGATFTAANTGPNLIGQPTFRALVRVDASVVCLFADTFFTGDYAITNGPTSGVWGSVYGVDQTIVTLSRVGATQRAFTTAYGPEVLGQGFQMTQVINFVCDTTIAVDAALGAGCGGAGISVGQGTAPGTMDLFDDSVFTLNVVDDKFSSCASAIDNILMTFTKQ